MSNQTRRSRRGRRTDQRRLAVEALENRLNPAPAASGPQIMVTSYFDSALYEFNASTGALSATLVAPNSGGLLNGPAGVTVGPDGDLYISSQLNNAVLKYDFQTATLSTFIPSSVLQPIAASIGTANFAPAGLRFGPDGNLYVELNGGQTSTTGAVERFNVHSAAGNLTYGGSFTTVDSVGLVQPTEMTFGIAAGDTNNLYVSDSGMGSVVKITGATSASPTAATFIAPGSGGLNYPASLLFGPDGKLYVVDLGATTHQGNVLRFNTDGSFDSVFTKPNGSGQGNLLFQFPSDAVFDTNGNLLTANLGPSYPPALAGSIFQFNSSGTYTQTLVSSSSFSNTGPGLSGISPSQLALFAVSPVISVPSSPTLVVGSPGSAPVVATGSPAPTVTETGTLPTGVSFDPTTGTISGTPATGSNGTYTITITANNGVGNAVSQPVTVTVLTPQESLVQNLYKDELGRSGSTAELDVWVGLLNAPIGSASVIANDIARSFEARDHLVKGWYQTYLKRPAVNGEEVVWVNQLLAGQTEQQVLGGILGSSEFVNDAQSLVNTGSQQQRYVQALYQAFLNRTASATELAAWTNLMPRLSTQAVAQDIQQSVEYRGDLFSGYYHSLLNRAPDQAGLNAWVQSSLDNTGVRTGIEASAEFVIRAEAGA